MAELWRRVVDIQGGRHKDQRQADDLNITADEPNAHYVSISTDSSYTAPAQKLTDVEVLVAIDDPMIFHILDHLHHTAEGQDGLPAWFVRLIAAACAAPLAHLVSLSLLVSHVPGPHNYVIPPMDDQNFIPRHLYKLTSKAMYQ